jgi:hypothetical protein
MIAGAKGASAAAAANGTSLTAGERFKAAGQGLLKNAPNLGRRTRSAVGKLGDAKAAGKGGYESKRARDDEKATTALINRSGAAREGLRLKRLQKVHKPAQDAALAAAEHARKVGNHAGADQLEREYYDSVYDPRTGVRHPDDPLHPMNLRRSATGGIDGARRVRPVERGEDMLRSSGMSKEQAAVNLDSLLALYGNNPANIDRSHAAGEVLWQLQGQIHSGNLFLDAERRDAAAAVAAHGVPDKIDAVGQPANVQVSMNQFLQVAHELPVNQVMGQAATADGRMQLLQKVDALAAEIPVATALSTALNDLRQSLGEKDAKSTQIQQALQNVQQAAGRIPAPTNPPGGGTP